METTSITIPQDITTITLVTALTQFADDWQRLYSDLTDVRDPSPDLRHARENFVTGYNLLVEAVASLVAHDIRLSHIV